MAEEREYDLKYMRRALDLAAMAGGGTRPNPLVGAVIVRDNQVIGEGYHRQAGEAHAEVEALLSVKDRSQLSGADIYVTLEPCSHWGKTPPCAEMIVREGFGRVIIGTRDTSSKVSGRGIEILKSGGCEIIEGVMDLECRKINSRFFTFHEKGRPLIILKWAETDDGFFDAERVEGQPPGPNWITGHSERILVHKWRSLEHAVMVGENTLCNDDPLLDVRLWPGRSPVRVILSGSESLRDGYRIFSGGEPTLVFTTHPSDNKGNVEYIRISARETALLEVLGELHRRDIQSLLVEGGANVLSQFITAGLWDEARIFRGKTRYGSGLPAPQISGTLVDEIEFESSNLNIYSPM